MQRTGLSGREPSVWFSRQYHVGGDILPLQGGSSGAGASRSGRAARQDTAQGGSMARRKATKRSGSRDSKSGNGANLGFEATLWAAADKLRGHMDASKYKHVVLGLIFLKYISDNLGARL